eukprot:SAG22_NODE_1680_length_3824_cov_1.537181_4_plen_303_part_00
MSESESRPVKRLAWGAVGAMSSPPFHLLPLLLLLLLALALPRAAADLNATDAKALLAIKAAQPADVQRACAALKSWGLSGVDGCEWPGITCTEPDQAGDQVARVSVIDLRYCGLTALPAAPLASFDQLKVLEVRGNAIKVLPKTVKHLVSMERIMIEMNELGELPDEICACHKLTNLYIAYNRLTSLPACIGDLGPSLRDIWLRGNSIPALPESFCELGLLSSGYMMAAGIEELPECFGRVGAAAVYQHLELEGNKLTRLPDSLRLPFATGRCDAKKRPDARHACRGGALVPPVLIERFGWI